MKTNEPPTSHLVVRYGPDAVIDEYTSYEAALVAWRALVGDDDVRRLAFAVRAVDDPRWVKAPRAGAEYDADRRAARRAVADWRRKAIGATAAWAIKICSLGNYNSVVIAAVRSLAERGITAERWEVEAAVKARVIIGRCRNGGPRSYSRSGCGRAYWFPKGSARLSDTACPHCNRTLDQTSLAYGATFRSLAHERALVAS